jgi:hypothetical protein
MIEQIEKDSHDKLNDFKHHLNTVRRTEMSKEDFDLLSTRLKY